MVLEMKAPHGTGLADLKPILPVFLSYVLSFIYIGIYWSNHHHLLHATRERRDPVGQPAPAVLAVARSVRDRLDRQESLRRIARGALRPRAAARGRRLHDSPVGDRRQTGPRLDPRQRAWARPQGKALAGSLRRRDRGLVRESVAGRGAVRVGGRDVAGARPSAGAGRGKTRSVARRLG